MLWGQEADSPRGRIYLMKAGLDGRAEWSDAYQRHFDTCLGCMACVTACPSGVKYDRLIEATRPQVERHGDRSAGDRVFRQLIFGLFPHPNRLRAMTGPLALYQRTGLQRMVRSLGLTKLLPGRVAAMERLLPPIPSNDTRELPERIAATGDTRRRVGLLLGCVQRVFFPHVNTATARVLAAEGCEVVAPSAQPCCGALLVHAGEEEQALKFARQTIDAFEKAQVDEVIINAAGCGSTLKEYGHLLRDDPAYAARARAFAAKCRDISEFLAELAPRATWHALRVRVAYHDACHLQHAQGIRAQPRVLLSRIPQLQLLEIPEAAVCCGSAGIYNLVQPEAAAQLGDRKAGHLAALEADMIVTSNPGCLLQLQSALERTGRKLPVRHIVELLDASIRGVSL